MNLNSGKGAFEIQRSFLYSFLLEPHFRIFVHKFLIHFHTMHASPQNLAWPLFMHLAQE